MTRYCKDDVPLSMLSLQWWQIQLPSIITSCLLLRGKASTIPKSTHSVVKVFLYYFNAVPAWTGGMLVNAISGVRPLGIEVLHTATNSIRFLLMLSRSTQSVTNRRFPLDSLVINHYRCVPRPLLSFYAHRTMPPYTWR